MLMVIMLNLRDLRPGMRHVNITVEVLNTSESEEVVTSAGLSHEILELEVGHKSASLKLVLRDEKIISHFKRGDMLKIDGGL